jgi:hypothetical protein
LPPSNLYAFVLMPYSLATFSAFVKASSNLEE